MKATLSSLHHQGNDWLRELDFYKEELTILSTRLGEAMSKNTGQEAAAQVEHFQNTFIMLREQMDVLAHDVRAREQEVEAMVKERPEHIDEHFTVAKSKILGRMQDLSKTVAETRFEFNRFLAKMM